MKNGQPVLLILTPGFPKDEQDTSCLPFAQSLIKTINHDFSSVKIIVLSFHYPFAKNETLWHTNLVISFAGKNKGKLARRLLWIRVWQKLRNIYKHNNVIGLFSLWAGECAFIGNRFGKKNSIPHYCWILGQDARAHNKYAAKISGASKELIAISDSVAHELFKNYLIPTSHTIPNGIDTELFQNKSYPRNIDILGAGSLIPLKQYGLFVDCIHEIRKTLPQIIAVIAGHGPEEIQLRNKISELRLENNVLLNGNTAHDHLLHLMQQTKVFLHPSSYEGFSMACLEALYAGCQVISFCKPMDQNIENWHIVKTEEEMAGKALEILTGPPIEYTSVIPYSIKDTGRSIMNLFIH